MSEHTIRGCDWCGKKIKDTREDVEEWEKHWEVRVLPNGMKDIGAESITLCEDCVGEIRDLAGSTCRECPSCGGKTKPNDKEPGIISCQLCDWKGDA